MGGNARAINRTTGETLAYAQRIILTNHSRFLLDMVPALEQLNERFKERTGHLLWRNVDVLLRKGHAFNGSVSHLLSGKVSYAEMINHKPSLGDIDVTVPDECLPALFDFLAENEGKKFGQLEYVGQNRPKFFGSQISSIFDWGGTINVQVDFEGVPYKNGLPTDFAKFAHSSDWGDTVRGIKGVAHKYLLMCVAWTVSDCSDWVVLTPNSPIWPPNKARLKTLHQPVREMSFSVDKGLRERLNPVMYENAAVKVGGKYAFKEKPTSESKYVTDLFDIFMTLFCEKPSPGELEKMWSFFGVMDLCESHFWEERIKTMFDQLVRYKLFGPGQGLSRDPKTDKEIKKAIIEAMVERFPYLTSSRTPVADLMTEYYDSYKERGSNDDA